MKNTDKIKKKLTFSVIDFVIIALVIALVAGIFVRYDIIGKLFEKTTLTDASISFVAEALTAEEAAQLTEGKKLYLDGELFGSLTAVAKENAQIFTEDQSGKLISYESTELFDITGSIKIKVLKTDGGYLLGGNRFIAAGSSFILGTPGAAFKVTVLSLSETDR